MLCFYMKFADKITHYFQIRNIEIIENESHFSQMPLVSKTWGFLLNFRARRFDQIIRNGYGIYIHSGKSVLVDGK